MPERLAPRQELGGLTFNTLWARAYATATATGDAARAAAIAEPILDLVNFTDEPYLIRLLVRIPGRFPTDAAPSAYFDSASVDFNGAEYARTFQTVAILPSWVTDDSELIWPLVTRRETSMPASGPGGPDAFDHFGVPFENEYRLFLPTGLVARGDIIESHILSLALHVQAVAYARSLLGTGSEALTAVRPLCELVPPSRMSEIRPNLDPLCRAGRAVARHLPVCDCVRDASSQSQRCTFQFSDFNVAEQLPPPVLPGQPVEVEWTINSLTDGEWWMRPEYYDGGKWVAMQTKEKLGGKLMQGKETRARATFTMPKNPTLIRARMYHLPKGAKEAIESQIDVSAAVRKVKVGD